MVEWSGGRVVRVVEWSGSRVVRVVEWYLTGGPSPLPTPPGIEWFLRFVKSPKHPVCPARGGPPPFDHYHWERFHISGAAVSWPIFALASHNVGQR